MSLAALQHGHTVIVPDFCELLLGTGNAQKGRAEIGEKILQCLRSIPHRIGGDHHHRDGGVPRICAQLLQELQAVADSADRLKRNRGRRGLDTINKLQSEKDLEISIYEKHGPAVYLPVDQKLVALAKKLDGRIVTVAERAVTRVVGRYEESRRGAGASQWQVEKILEAGFGLATAYYEEIEPELRTRVEDVLLNRRPDATERLLQQYLPPERVGGIMDEIRGPAGRNMWEKLANVQEEVLANYLKNEYPQTVAVVLSKLRPEHAARVLSILPEDLSLDCVNRMLKMEAVQKEVIERVEQTLRTEFMSNLSQTRRRDAHEVMAEIFNNFDRQTETRFLTALEEDNRDAAERIKALMFTFDDLVKLDTGSAQTLMRNIDKEKLAVALKGANETVRQFFFTNMSSRAAKLLVEDMQAMGPVRLRDVDEAQALLVNVAKDLAAKGEIIIAKSRGEDELIY